MKPNENVIVKIWKNYCFVPFVEPRIKKKKSKAKIENEDLEFKVTVSIIGRNIKRRQDVVKLKDEIDR